MIRALLLAVLGVASFAGVYYFAVPSSESPTTIEFGASPPTSSEAMPETGSIATVPVDVSQSMTFELRPGAEAVPQSTEQARVVRNVTPDNMTAGPRVTGTLARVATPDQPTKAGRERLFNAIVLSAGVVKAKNQEIRFAGIAAPGFEERCGEGSAAWPCGRMARAALQRFIRGRAIDCDVPAGADKVPDVATCTVGAESMSEWLIAQGWAKRAGDSFEEAETKAREAKLGLWSDGRPDQASQVASTSGG